MNPLNKKAKCQKCGHPKVSLTWCAGTSMYQPCYGSEHFCRRCQLCGYEWKEAVPKARTVKK